MGITGSNRVVAFARVVGPIGGYGPDGLIGWDLIEQLRQHWCVTDIAGGDLHGSDFQRFLVDANVYLAPNPAFRATMLAGVPLAFTFGFDARAIDQKVQRPGSSAIREADIQGFLAAAQSAEVWHRPIQADEPQQALYKPGCLPERHPEQHLERQARLDRSITETLLPAALAARRRYPNHLRIKPDRQGSASLQAVVVSRPVRGLVLCRGQLLMPPSYHAGFTR